MHAASGTWLGSGSEAVLILDALSLRELPILMGAAEARSSPVQLRSRDLNAVHTDHFLRLGLPSRSALARRQTRFALFSAQTVAVGEPPFEDSRSTVATVIGIAVG